MELVRRSGKKQRQLWLAASVLLRSPYESPTPIVVQPPKPQPANVPGDSKVPPGDDKSTGPEPAPEPATLLTAAVGSGLALLSWARLRRRPEGPSA